MGLGSANPHIPPKQPGACSRAVLPPLGKYLLGAHSASGIRSGKLDAEAPSPLLDVPTKTQDLGKPFETADVLFWGGSSLHNVSPPLSHRLPRAVPESEGHSPQGRSRVDLSFPFSKAGPEALSNLITAERAATRKSSDWFPVPGSCRLGANPIAPGTVSNQKSERKGCTQPPGSRRALPCGTAASVCEGGRARVGGRGEGRLWPPGGCVRVCLGELQNTKKARDHPDGEQTAGPAGGAGGRGSAPRTPLSPPPRRRRQTRVTPALCGAPQYSCITAPNCGRFSAPRTVRATDRVGSLSRGQSRSARRPAGARDGYGSYTKSRGSPWAPALHLLTGPSSSLPEKAVGRAPTIAEHGNGVVMVLRVCCLPTRGRSPQFTRDLRLYWSPPASIQKLPFSPPGCPTAPLPRQGEGSALKRSLRGTIGALPRKADSDLHLGRAQAGTPGLDSDPCTKDLLWEFPVTC